MEAKSWASCWVLLVPVIVSCGGSQPPAGTPPAPTSSSSASVAPAPSTAWKDMNTEQRKQFMKTTVYPRMQAEFVAFDAKRFTDMNCVTCHGDSAKDGTFKMPNPRLPKLPSDEAGFKALMEKKPDITKFMGSKVVPDMAMLLDEQPFNPKTHQGFGCFECHTK